MSGRAELTGDQRAIASKLASRYDPDMEAEVIDWFQQLTGEDVPPGMRSVENALRTGVALIKLAQAIQKGTANIPAPAAKMKLKVNTGSAPFKQMENINNFVAFCRKYGVEKTGTFQTVDLYEGRNMAQVLNCISQLGSEAQRHGFNGPVIGAKPIEQNKRKFTKEQLRGGHGVVGLQAGTNKFASQKGYGLGKVRHCADIRADDMNKEAQTLITLQAGTNLYASQKGMSIGSVRHVSDIRADDLVKEGQDVIGLQAGSNKFASQKGMRIGSVRHVSDIRADDLVKEGQTMVGYQAGSNKYASQKGMTAIGALRHAPDIKVDAMESEAEGIIGLQAGSNKFANQSGMRIGGVRHCGDVTGDQDMTQDSQGNVGYQLGGFKGANQSGMRIGGVRHVRDIPCDDADRSTQGVINLQMGTNLGDSQRGMSSFGAARDVGGAKYQHELQAEAE